GWFDFSHALRALANLLENAAKYSPAGTPIAVSVSRDDDTIAISVADRGGGVDAGERDRIFEPFYRPAGVWPDVGGAGLGLAIARQLAEVQGGSVEYAPREGGGSVFTLRLPAAGDVVQSADDGVDLE
ncbi:MAG TPA: sensor histidine kinase, partial [Candidatus Elarobacter sp.]|nr:sensor histidine kinase [Candidatus Elarobacter sp.]